MTKHPFDPEINLIRTGGAFGLARRLPTMTIHLHENGRYFVTDDVNEGRTLSAGHATIEDAVRANKWLSDKRTWA